MSAINFPAIVQNLLTAEKQGSAYQGEPIAGFPVADERKLWATLLRSTRGRSIVYILRLHFKCDGDIVTAEVKSNLSRRDRLRTSHAVKVSYEYASDPVHVSASFVASSPTWTASDFVCEDVEYDSMNYHTEEHEAVGQESPKDYGSGGLDWFIESAIDCMKRGAVSAEVLEELDMASWLGDVAEFFVSEVKDISDEINAVVIADNNGGYLLDSTVEFYDIDSYFRSINRLNRSGKKHILTTVGVDVEERNRKGIACPTVGYLKGVRILGLDDSGAVVPKEYKSYTLSEVTPIKL